MRKQLPKLFTAFKKGFAFGAIASFMIYGCVRILFAGFDFTISEEIINIVKITGIGGILLGAAIVFFQSIELIILYSRPVQKFRFSFNDRKFSHAAA